MEIRTKHNRNERKLWEIVKRFKMKVKFEKNQSNLPTNSNHEVEVLKKNMDKLSENKSCSGGMHN
jgi:hypothetical protein